MSIKLKISIKKLNTILKKCYFKICYGTQKYTSQYANEGKWNETVNFDYDAKISDFEIKFYAGLLGYYIGTILVTKSYYVSNSNVNAITNQYITYANAEHQWIFLSESENLEACLRIGVNLQTKIKTNYNKTKQSDEPIELSIKDNYDLATQENNNSIQITNNCLKLINESNKINNDILETIDMQMNQIKDSNRGLDVVQNNLKNSKRKIRGIESIFGPVINKFTKKHKIKVNKNTYTDSKSNKTHMDKHENHNINANIDVKNYNMYAHVNIDESTNEYNETQKIIDNNILELHLALNNFSTTANCINTKMKEEIKEINNLEHKIERTNLEMEDITKQANIILKKK
mgnify:CR=1 FL=1